MRTAFAITAIFLAGCITPADKMHRAQRSCPGKNNVNEAIETLNRRSLNSGPIRASGQCILRYHIESKQHKENFSVKLWINPPDEIYLQGDIAFDAAGLVLGANAEEFWFWLKPKEISSYWWGDWQQQFRTGFAINPSIILQAFGQVNLSDGDWSLTKGQSDILSQYDEQGTLLKRIYIERCDYVINKIEHFDSAGVVTIQAQFDDYRQIAENFFLPEKIKIIAVNNGKEDSAEISLSSVKQTQFNTEQKQRLFVRPKPRGFDHIYKIIDGSAVEQMSE